MSMIRQETNRDDFLTLYPGYGLVMLWHSLDERWHLVVVLDERLPADMALQAAMETHLGQCRMVIERSE